MLRIPTATYRLQFAAQFRFSDARAVIGYLHELGISDVYASPIFQARSGSLHGYDVVDPNRLNQELGTQENFDALVEEVRRHGMGWVQDIVPNHMAYDGQNRMLMDVLENGQGSAFFNTFDIEWNHPYESIRGRVLAPFLGDIYGQCLENGEIKLVYDESGLSINYYNLKFPLSVESYSKVFSDGVGRLRRKLGGDHPDFIKLLGALYGIKNLPSSEENKERADQIVFVKRMLWELHNSSPEIRAFIEENVSRFNGEKGNPESFNSLDQLLSEQLFRLSFWKVATEEINYRRFFNINELLCLKAEDEKVFEHTHSLVFSLLQEGKITGLRIDHIDGLYDPTNYLKRIRERAGDIYLSVEKILGLGEEVPSTWPIQGTTGYDFLNYVNGIFCQKKSEKRFSQIYSRFCGSQTSFSDIVAERKRLTIGKHMAGDVDGLAHLLKGISSRDRFGGDITLYGLKRALVEVLTFFPIYRSYISQESFSDQDRSSIQEAIRRAQEANPGLVHELSFIERFLLLRFPEHLSEEEKKQWIHFVMRFQQFTGPLIAKGLEDTSLYVYNRMLSLNEVGGDPGTFGISLEEFHEFNARRARRWRHAMNATATHDTKRGEDARARINVLSEIPEEWEKNLKNWSRMNRGRKKLSPKGREIPDRNDEYFFYQTLIGAIPLEEHSLTGFLERLKAYMIKAVREAKVHTEWLKPDTAYEEAFVSFIESVLKPSPSNRFLSEFLTFARKVATYGLYNALSQTLIKVFSPGTPDFYQGTELWDLSFVDPDNRRAVDFEARRELLRELKERDAEDRAALHQELLRRWQDGRIKLYVTYKALNFRRDKEGLFRQGKYLPVYASGAKKEQVCAFARQSNGTWALIAAPRLLAGVISADTPPLGHEVWGASALLLPKGSPERWMNILSGETIEAALMNKRKTLALHRVFSQFPVALLAAA